MSAALPPELKATLEQNAKARGVTGTYARMALALLPLAREAIGQEIAMATPPNDVVTALGSIFGQVVTELIAVRSNNPSFMIARAAAAYVEQCQNMMISAAGVAGANAKGETRAKLVLPDARRQ